MAAALDQAKKEEFAGQMVSMVNQAFTAVLVSVGYRTGLYWGRDTVHPQFCTYSPNRLRAIPVQLKS